MYKTGAIKVKTQILETIFAELPQTAKKVKLSIKFDEEEKLNTFKRLEAEREEDEEECASLDSESQSEEENDLNEDSKQKDANSKDVAGKKQVIQKRRYQKIDVSLEEGIIYKQFYQKEFQKVGEANNNIKIKIRAQKITFQGWDIEDIEDAMDDAKTLMDKIEVEYIPKYGLEMSESAMINKMLEKIGIKIFRILDKYYRWYEVDPRLSPDEQKKKKSDIKEVLRKIDSANHCLQYLSTIEKNVDMYKGSLNNDFQKLRYKFMSYRPLLESLKGEIFEKEFKSKLNEESTNEEQIEVQLSLTKDALVFHSVAKQLLQMSIKDVKTLYQSYSYFFLTIDSDCPIQPALQTLQSYSYDTVQQKSRHKPIVANQIEEVKQTNYIHFMTNYEKVRKRIENKMNDPGHCGDYVPKESVVFCVGFRRKVEEKKMDYLCEVMERLQAVWEGVSYKISILLEQPEEIEDPRISYEFNNNQRIFSLAANQTSLQTNLSILRDYIIKQKIQTKRMKQPNLDPEQNNVSLSTINPGSVINESTVLQVLQEKSISQDINASPILEGISGINSVLGLGGGDMKEEPDEKCVKLLADYKVYIPETSKEYNEKYKDLGVKENAIVKVDKRNRGIEDDLTKITDCNFQVYKIQLNPKHKIDSYYQDPGKDQVVTVFLSGKVSPFVKPKGTGLKIQEGMNEMFPVRVLGKAKEAFSENGYLVNIRKRSIIVDGKSFKVKYGEEFEVAKELAFLKK